MSKEILCNDEHTALNTSADTHADLAENIKTQLALLEIYKFYNSKK